MQRLLVTAALLAFGNAACGARSDPGSLLGSGSGQASGSGLPGRPGSGSTVPDGDPVDDPGTPSYPGDPPDADGGGADPPPPVDPLDAGVAPPGVRRSTCITYCIAILAADPCPGDPIADSLNSCVDSCADRRGICAIRVLDAFRCVAEKADTAVACDDNGNAVLRCGPCDEELTAVARACPDAEIRCTFR